MLLHGNLDSTVKDKEVTPAREDKLVPHTEEATTEQMGSFSLTGRGDHRDLFRRQLRGGHGGTCGGGHLSRGNARRLHRKPLRIPPKRLRLTCPRESNFLPSTLHVGRTRTHGGAAHAPRSSSGTPGVLMMEWPRRTGALPARPHDVALRLRWV